MTYALSTVIVLVVLQTITYVHVKADCQFGSAGSEGSLLSTQTQYVDLQHPLTCPGSIVAWRFCFYTDNIESITTYEVYFRIYRNETGNRLGRIHDIHKSIILGPEQVGNNSFMCLDNALEESDCLSVMMGDYLATYIPPTVSRHLFIVGTGVPGSLLHRDTRPFSQTFTSTTVPVSNLTEVEGGSLHLYADVVSPCPQPTNIDSVNTRNNTDGGGSSSDVAAITSVVVLIFLLALLIIPLAVGIVLYRRWKVEQLRKSLHQTHPPAPLAMDNATYDLPMLSHDYRLWTQNKNKSGGSTDRSGELSIASENIYDEGLAEVFAIYETLKTSSSEFRSSMKKVVYTMSKTKPTPYEVPASQEEQIYEQISGQRVPSLSTKHMQLVGHLGSGQFANVEKAVWSRKDGIIEVAVKTLYSDALPAEKLKLLQEGAMMSQFRHPNVVFLYGIITENNQISLVMEYISKGDLKGCLQWIKSNPEDISDTDRAQLLLSYSNQVALGMLYLSYKGFVHRDLAARNILVSEQDVCKIADFGMSRNLVDAEYYISEGGTIPIRWTAPEAIYYRKYSTASDVWSYGCLLYEIWSLGHKPFENCSNTEVLKEISVGFRLPPPPGCPYKIYELMIKCWNPLHSKRPSFRDLLVSLLEDEQTILEIPIEDASTHQQAACLGATMQAGHKMYSHLQTLYLSSSTSFSDRPSSNGHDPHTEEHYESVEDEEAAVNANTQREIPTEESTHGDGARGYGDTGSEDRQEIHDAIYDKIAHDHKTGDVDTRPSNEDYYNVVATDTSNKPTKKSDINKLTLPPKPRPRNLKQKTSGSELVGDCFEASGSVFTINNDKVVV